MAPPTAPQAPSAPPPPQLPPLETLALGTRDPVQGGSRVDSHSPTAGSLTPPPTAPLTIHPGDGEARGDHHHHQPEAGAVVVQKDQPVHAPLEHKSQVWSALIPAPIPSAAPSPGRKKGAGSRQASRESKMIECDCCLPAKPSIHTIRFESHKPIAYM